MRICIFSVVVIFLTPVFAIATSPLAKDGPRLVIVPPWVSVAEVVEMAGGQVIGPRLAPMGALAYSSSPKFVTDVKRNGGWAVLDGAALSQICQL